MTHDPDYHEKATSNSSKLQYEIDLLSSGHWHAPFERNYKSFWSHAKEISSLFKTLKPLRHNDRERLWESFQIVCNEAKSTQQSEYEDRELKSADRRGWILSEVKKAEPFPLPPPTADELKELGEILHNASQMLTDYKEDMLGNHKQECFERIKEVRHVHDLYWDEIKKKRSQKHEEFQARVRMNLERNYERHRKATVALESVRRHANDLQEQINSAWSDSFRDRAYEWLSEAEDKIRDIEESISQIEDWIKEDESKLD